MCWLPPPFSRVLCLNHHVVSRAMGSAPHCQASATPRLAWTGPVFLLPSSAQVSYSWTWRQSLWGSWTLWSLSALSFPPDTLLATASPWRRSVPPPRPGIDHSTWLNSWPHATSWQLWCQRLSVGMRSLRWGLAGLWVRAILISLRRWVTKSKGRPECILVLVADSFHFRDLHHCICSSVKAAQSCLTLCDPMDYTA